MLFLILIAFAAFVSYLWYTSYKVIAEKKTIEDQIRQIPKLELNTLEGASVSLYSFDNEVRIIVLYFNTRCAFCQFELKELKRRVPEFIDTEIVLISAEPLDTLRPFDNKLQFDLYPNAGIYHCPYDTLYKYFGKLIAPTTFIYGTDKKLLKKFKGATRIDDMLSVIEQEMINNGDHPMYE